MPDPDPPLTPAGRTDDPTPAPETSRYGALGYRNFRLYFAGHLTSLLGWSMHSVAVPWLVLLLTDSPFYVGLVSMLGTLPIMFLSLYGGVIADRFPRRQLLLVTQSAAMIIALALAAAVLLDVVTLVAVMIAVTLLGVTAAFDIPGRQSFIGDLVGKVDLMNAVALNSASFNGSRIVGPGIAGILIGVAGVGVCFLINGISYVALILALLAMRFRPAATPPERPARRSTVRDGLAYVASDKRMRSLIMLIAIASIFGFPFYVLLPVLARNVMGLGAVEFGWMVSAAALGALVAALGLATLGSRVPKGRTISIAAPTFGLLVSSLGYAPSFGALMALLMLTGFFQVVHTATTNTLLQSIAQDELRGRVMSVYSLAFLGLMPLGSLLAGAVADRWSPAAWLSVSGLICAGLMLTVLRWAPEIRRTA
jgi:MFS family permease